MAPTDSLLVNASRPAAVEENIVGNATARTWLSSQWHLKDILKALHPRAWIIRKENKMTSLKDLGAIAPARTSVFHPEHPLHHLVLDLAEQVDQAFEQWLVKVAPGSIIEEQSVSE
jgi:hypothetical protein